MSHESFQLADELLELINGSWKTQAIRAASELKLADLISRGIQSSRALAAATAMDESSLRRLLRALVSIGVVSEPSEDTFTLTAMGDLLRSDSKVSLRAWSIWWGRYCWPVWEALPYSLQSGRSARAMLSKSSGFEHLDRDPEAAAIFNAALAELTRLATQDVLRTIDFSRFLHVIDVGGGSGELLLTILESNPGVSGTLFDRPHAIDSASARFAALGVGSRCRFIAGDFFQSVPSGGDAYVLKSVIHDWDDERALRILSNCRTAMTDGNTLLLVERIIPARMDVSKASQSVARSDLHMLVALGAHERTEEQFKALLEKARFRVGEIRRAGNTMNIVEAQPDL